MSLVMKRGKDCVRFEVTDGEVESVVTLLPEDDKETLVRKMRRVIALVEPGPEGPVRRLLASQADVAAWRQEREGSWTAPKIPDRLKGEVEMDTAEPVIGNGWGEGPPSA